MSDWGEINAQRVVDLTWGSGSTAEDEPDECKPGHDAFNPKSSANPKENIDRAAGSRWAAAAVNPSSADDEFGGSEHQSNATGAGKSSGDSKGKSALDRMKLGNGSGYIAPRPEWASAAARYEWKDEYGDVGPVIPELEKQLYDDAFINKMGEAFDRMEMGAVEVTVESEERIKPMFKWEEAGIHPVMLENIEKCGYSVPTAVQGYCIPAVLTGHDVIAIAQTGSGKTAAYLVPTLSKLMGKAKKLGANRPRLTDDFDPMIDGTRAEPLILIVVPTRELAIQIFDEARRLCYRSMLRPCVAYGGGPMREQMDDLRKGCDLLIASPGRLIDFLERPNLLSLQRVRYTVIDEADELIGPDWITEMEQIVSGTDSNQDGDHHFMMFSATFPKEARALAKRHLADDHVRVRVGRTGSAHKHVSQKVIWVDNSQKNQAVFDLLVAMPPARTMIFVNSRRSCDSVDDFLFNCGLPSTSLHSERTQRERESAIRGFREGTAPIMVATGISARGLDFFNVMHIINYDLPSTMHGGIDEYVHRIGRTARIGNLGTASSFYNERNEDLAQDLVNILLECDQEVPDFLEHLKPSDGANPEFRDQASDSESADGDVTATDNDDSGWGTIDPANDGGW